MTDREARDGGASQERDLGDRDASTEDGSVPQDDLEPVGGDSASRSPEEELGEVTDRYLRLAAEFDNYRRRVQGELRESGVRAQAALLARLLEGLDDLERVTASATAETTAEVVVEGVRLVEQKLLHALGEAGVEVLIPTEERFDPEVMEALMRISTSDPEEDDRVEQVFQRGFLLKGHLVRPARVSVRKVE